MKNQFKNINRLYDLQNQHQISHQTSQAQPMTTPHNAQSQKQSLKQHSPLQHLQHLPLQHLESFEENYNEEQMEQIRSQELQKQKQQIMQNLMAIICGLIFFIITTIIAIWVFKTYFYSYIVQYIPDELYTYLPFLTNPTIKLTQSTASEYFKQNPIYGAQLHYPRIVSEYWEERILQLKSMGLNTISTYVFWNFHEIEKGVFDFESDRRNLTKLFTIAEKHQMKVLLRPGPYICAQWDWGGLPVRLLSKFTSTKTNLLSIRSNNEQFLSETKIYFQSLYKVIEPFLYKKSKNKGTIIMIQIENQPGFYSNTSKQYILALKHLWENIITNPQKTVPFYYCQSKDNIQKRPMYWQNAIIALNSAFYEHEVFEEFQKKGHFIFGGQVYTGWFTKWGEQHYTLQNQYNFAHRFEQFFKNNQSFVLYVAAGGTNFGLTAGAFNPIKKSSIKKGISQRINTNDIGIEIDNRNQEQLLVEYKPVITSYDYGAPITQSGIVTSNFHVFRSLIHNHTKQTLPEIFSPENYAINSHHTPITIKPFKMTVLGSLFDNTAVTQAKSQSNFPSFNPTHPTILQSHQPLLFQTPQLQMYNQGLVLYTKYFTPQLQYSFHVEVHDWALIYLNGKLIKRMNRMQSQSDNLLEFSCMGTTEQNADTETKTPLQCKVQILVEAMGHVNFKDQMAYDLKGILKMDPINYDMSDEELKWLHERFRLEGREHQTFNRDSVKESSNIDTPFQEKHKQSFTSPFDHWKLTSKCYRAPCLLKGEFILNQNQGIQVSKTQPAPESPNSLMGDTYFDVGNSHFEKGYIWVNGYLLGRYWRSPQQKLFCPGVWLKNGKNEIAVLEMAHVYDDEVTGQEQQQGNKQKHRQQQEGSKITIEGDISLY